ncbi:SAVMC3_10250 family protein [Streptomyces sp. NPDC055775]
MRELVYLSEQKLQRMFVALGRGIGTPSAEATVGLPGLSVTLTTASPTPTPDGLADATRKLDKVIRFLERNHRPVDFAAPGVRTGHWVSFDLPMGWGIGPEAAEAASDGLALFVGTASADVEGPDGATGLLLCGTAGHFRHRTVTASRPGSDRDAMYQYLADLKAAGDEEDGPETASRADRAPDGPDLDAYVVCSAFDALSGHWPPPQRGRMRGHARVLLTADHPGRSTRLVVATPLYVENPPPRLPSRWSRLWRRGHARTGS